MLVAAADKAPKRKPAETTIVSETKKKSVRGDLYLGPLRAWKPSVYVIYHEELFTGQKTEPPKTNIVKPPNPTLPPPYPHPGAVFDGWRGLVSPGEKVNALAAGRYDGACDTLIWQHFVAVLKSTKPQLLSVILHKHLNTTYKHMLFGATITDSNAVPAMIEGMYEKLPDNALRYAFSCAKLDPNYKGTYKQDAWKWAMTNTVLKHCIIFRCITPDRRARLLEQLRENAEWERMHGSLWFDQCVTPPPFPIATGNPKVDALANQKWIQDYNAAAIKHRQRCNAMLNDMIRTSRFMVRRYEYHS